jgi:hypothetical protein
MKELNLEEGMTYIHLNENKDKLFVINESELSRYRKLKKEHEGFMKVIPDEEFLKSHPVEKTGVKENGDEIFKINFDKIESIQANKVGFSWIKKGRN